MDQENVTWEVGLTPKETCNWRLVSQKHWEMKTEMAKVTIH